MTTRPLVAMACIALFLLPCPTLAGSSKKPNTKIVVAWSVSPSLIPVAETSSALVCFSNSNAASSKSLEPGDVFSMSLSIEGGSFESVAEHVRVSSATLGNGDFTVNRDANVISVRYVGPTRPFAPGDTVCVPVTIRAPETAAIGRLVLGNPDSASRYSTTTDQYAVLSAVDFPTGSGTPGPPGPVGPAGPAGPAGPPGAGSLDAVYSAQVQVQQSDVETQSQEFVALPGLNVQFSVDHQATVIIQGFVLVGPAGCRNQSVYDIGVVIDGSTDSAVTSGGGGTGVFVPFGAIRVLEPGSHVVGVVWRCREPNDCIYAAMRRVVVQVF